MCVEEGRGPGRVGTLRLSRLSCQERTKNLILSALWDSEKHFCVLGNVQSLTASGLGEEVDDVESKSLLVDLLLPRPAEKTSRETVRMMCRDDAKVWLLKAV